MPIRRVKANITISSFIAKRFVRTEFLVVVRVALAILIVTEEVMSIIDFGFRK